MKPKHSMQDKINNIYKKQEMRDMKNNDSQNINNDIDNDDNIPIKDENLEENANDVVNISDVNMEELLTKNAELEDMLKRKVAEFDNFKKRTDKEKMELLEYGNTKLFAIFVDLLDDLRNAKEAAHKHQDLGSLQSGIEMIYQKADKIFTEQGVKQMEVTVGNEFDVNMHEALMRQQSELPEGQITMILQPGYMYKDKVIRYAKVATSSGE